MFTIIILVFTFGFLVYRKVDMHQQRLTQASIAPTATVTGKGLVPSEGGDPGNRQGLLANSPDFPDRLTEKTDPGYSNSTNDLLLSNQNVKDLDASVPFVGLSDGIGHLTEPQTEPESAAAGAPEQSYDAALSTEMAGNGPRRDNLPFSVSFQSAGNELPQDFDSSHAAPGPDLNAEKAASEVVSVDAFSEPERTTEPDPFTLSARAEIDNDLSRIEIEQTPPEQALNQSAESDFPAITFPDVPLFGSNSIAANEPQIKTTQSAADLEAGLNEPSQLQTDVVPSQSSTGTQAAAIEPAAAVLTEVQPQLLPTPNEFVAITETTPTPFEETLPTDNSGFPSEQVTENEPANSAAGSISFGETRPDDSTIDVSLNEVPLFPPPDAVERPIELAMLDPLPQQENPFAGGFNPEPSQEDASSVSMTPQTEASEPELLFPNIDKPAEANAAIANKTPDPFNTTSPGPAADRTPTARNAPAMFPSSTPPRRTMNRTADGRFSLAAFNYQNSITAPVDDGNAYAVVTVQPGENYYTISKRVYGTIRYFSALAVFNQHRIPEPSRMRPGMKVLTPPSELLEQRYPELFADSKPKETLPSRFIVKDDGSAWYRVGEKETLSEISERFLGRSARWIEIYRMNQGILKDPNKLKPGITLALPDDAVEVHIAP